MSVPRSWRRGKHSDRPPPCRVCGSKAWWNGWREVTFRHLGVSGHVETQPGRRLHRAECSKRDCFAPSWTVYPPGRYPCRHFGLDVVAKAVATSAFELDDETRPIALAETGRRYACSGRSVARWTRWIVGLTDIEALARECARIAPDGMPVAVRPNTSHSRAQAGRALAVLDRFAGLLEQRDVLLRGSEPSLVRILDDQRLRHGVHFPLSNPSPPLSTGAVETALHGR